MVCSPIWLSEEHSRYLCRTTALLQGYEFRVVYDGTNLTALMSRPIVEELDLRDDRNNTSVERDDDATIEIIVSIVGGNLILLFVHIGAETMMR
jgi:hypothetical protein